MFYNKQKIKKLISDEVSKQIKKKEWNDFIDAKKEGYILKYKGLEWECLRDNGISVDLEICGQEKVVHYYQSEPLDIEFVYED